jgi:hypothetical protein
MGIPIFVLPLPLVREWDTLATIANCKVLIKQRYDESSAIGDERCARTREGDFPFGGQVSLDGGSVKVMICANSNPDDPEKEMFEGLGAGWLGMFHWDGHDRSSNQLAAELAAMFIASGAQCYGRSPLGQFLIGNTAIFRSIRPTVEQSVKDVRAKFRTHATLSPTAEPFFCWFSVADEADVGVIGFWGPALKLASGTPAAFLAIRKVTDHAKSASLFQQCVTWLGNQELERVQSQNKL